MRTLNRILQLVVTIIFLLFIAVGIFLAVIAVFEIRQLGAEGVAAILGMSVVTFVFLFIGMLFAFGLFSTLLEIAENTRVVRDAVESGDLKVLVTNDTGRSVATNLVDKDLSFGDGLGLLKSS